MPSTFEIAHNTAQDYKNLNEDKFAEFITERFPNEKDPHYIKKWAERITTGSWKRSADQKTRKALHKSGVVN